MPEKVLVRNADDREQVQEAEKRERRGRQDELDDVRSILSTRQGRRFFWRYFGITNVLRSCFSERDAVTFFNEGAQSVGLTMMRDLHEADPGAYLKMLAEAREDEEHGG